MWNICGCRIQTGCFRCKGNQARQPDQKVQLLRDGTEALVGVLAVILGGIEDEPETPVR